ncbi:MAG: UDP-N-acetylmuramoyl-L-alanyl-D-glutamate--2,6-diaminopimelate ligase [Burkholderiaceae bacterium]|nr:UDP-N-acetylmuramoyl-L-alanyl-D-glutamate--2,6-diaminopimelate ligase [Burkholderiaceae bacterium]
MSITALKSNDAAARWLRSWVTGTITTDSRKIRAGDGFIAWPGAATDGRRFVASALKAGATTCLVEREGLEAFRFDDARIASLPGLKAATGPIADAFFEQPSAALEVVATTGTNGKTSTAWWTAQALTLLGRRCAVVGTLGIGEPPRPASQAGGVPRPARPAQIDFTGLTTPDPVMLHSALRLFADGGFKACAIEASSIGIVEQRVAALRIAVALFTNFTRDHLDYHGSMEAYWAAKRRLFSWPGLRAAVINVDDAQGATLASELPASTLDIWTYSARGNARLCAQDIRYIDGGLAFDLHEGEQSVTVRSTLIGDYNASNLLAVVGGLRALGVALADAASVVPHLTPVPGRMQRVSVDAALPEVVVDYAHTPDALEKALLALRPLATARGGKLICIFGCGGNRDATKRPLMGAIAAHEADQAIVTSDNPRGEAPAAILADIVAGIARRGPVQTVEDRRAAIAQGIAAADARDVILIAGKGHEDYQEIAGIKYPFSDVAEAQAALARRASE